AARAYEPEKTKPTTGMPMNVEVFDVIVAMLISAAAARAPHRREREGSVSNVNKTRMTPSAGAILIESRVINRVPLRQEGPVYRNYEREKHALRQEGSVYRNYEREKHALRQEGSVYRNYEREKHALRQEGSVYRNYEREKHALRQEGSVYRNYEREKHALR